MKMVKSLLLGSAAGLVAVAGAQAADLPVKAKPVEYVKICSLYGDGFFYIPGTETCVRVGGSVQADHYYNALGNGHPQYDAAGSARDRSTNTWSQGKTRVDIAWDSRTQTAYGTLRAFLQLRIDNADQGTNTLQEPRGYIQWAGFTFGHTRSYSDPFATHGGGDGFGRLVQVQTHPDSGANGTNQIAYTFELGNGMVFVVGADERRPNSLTNLSTANVVTLGSAPTTSRAGLKYPDPYAVFRMSQAWGNFSAGVHLAQNSAVYYTNTPTCVAPAGQTVQGGTAQCAAPADKMGWVFLGGLQINLPMIAAGDRIGFFGAFGQGASKYTGANLVGASLYGGNTSIATGITTDGVYINGGAIQLTTSWSVGAAFEHWWTPQLKTTLFTSHAENSYNSNVVNGRLFCGGPGAGAAQGFLVGIGTVCDPSYKFSDIEIDTSWYPVPGFRLGFGVNYSKVDSAFAGQVITVLKAQGLRPTGAYLAKDKGITVVAFRANRGFGAVGGD